MIPLPAVSTASPATDFSTPSSPNTSFPSAPRSPNDTVAEHVAVGTVVGQLSTTGSYTGDSYTYALISGEGSTDNAYFAISRKNVTVNGNLDFEKKSAYSIRVRTTSSSGWITEQIFTIHVTDGFDPSISGRVWKDANANGLQDASESGFAYAFVELYSSTGTLIAQRQANASGQYSFQNLGVGSYYATVRIPQGYTFAKQNAGTDDALDSDVYSTGKSATFALSANQSITNLDAGITGSALSFGWPDRLTPGSTSGAITLPSPLIPQAMSMSAASYRHPATSISGRAHAPSPVPAAASVPLW